MWIGSLALAGIPPFAGFFSKDVILEAAWGAHTGVGAYAFWLGILVAFMTAFYSWRLLFMTFHGEPRADHHVMEHVHELPMVMLVPLVVLGIGADRAPAWFAYDWFVGGEEAMASVLGRRRGSPCCAAGGARQSGGDPAAHASPFWVKLLPLVIGVSASRSPGSCT